MTKLTKHSSKALLGMTLYEWVVKMALEWNSDDCLIWPYATAGPMNYGYLRNPATGKNVYAHRLAFYTLHGRWPQGQTMHKCDVPRCFNPRHLSEGTHGDNATDKMNKGRAGSPALKGTAHGRAKLTDDQVRQIRAQYPGNGLSMATMGKAYGVSAHIICLIVNRKTWKHI